MEFNFKPVPYDDLQDAIAIEQQGFPEDEAATLSAFQLRQKSAPDLFLGAYTDSRLVAYICATLSPDPSLTHHSMSTHVPRAASICIHSVCVSPQYKRQGIGLRLLREYVRRAEDANAGYERILLITHEPLRAFYEQAGFEWLGRSGVVHGSQPWFEMRYRIPAVPAPNPTLLSS